MPTKFPQASPVELVDWKRAAVSPFVQGFSDERKLKLVDLLRNEKGARILKFHQSLCPGCMEEKDWNSFLIDSVVFLKNSKVWIKKKCPKHGVFKEVYWADWELYKKAERFQDPGIQLETPHTQKASHCPRNCGLCSEHESHTQLGNIVVTNRCDLSCWYCFFYCKEGDNIYEPSMEQLKFMLQRMRDTKPIGANSVQFTGGEPTLREDLPEIIRAAKELGYKHVQLNTNGINLAKDPALARSYREAGISNLYLSFDGVTPQTNPKNYWEAPKAIENCHKAGIGVVLVPTIIGGVNDHEIGDILRFGFGNMHAVRSVNYQPVSLVGKMPDHERMVQRITIPSTIKKIEEQTDGLVSREDFFPVPCAQKVTNFVEAFKQKPKYRLSVHFACGMATYVFKDEKGGFVPLPRFFDVEGFFGYLGQLTEEVENARLRKVRKAVVLSKLMVNLRKFVDDKKKPKNLKIVRMLAGAIGSGDYKSLEEFHMNSLFIGMMHFQDPYNWDIDRVRKCGIHYAVPDGRVLPFCTFNVIPELYRDKVQREFSIPVSEWEKKTGKRLADDKHMRKISQEELNKIKPHYEPFRRFREKPKLWTDWGDEKSPEKSDFKRSSKKPGIGCRRC